MCIKCQKPLSSGNSYEDYDEDEDQYDDVMGRLVMDMEEEDEEIDLNDLDGQGQVKVWVCPICPLMFKRHGHFKTHACTAHDISQNDIDSITHVTMTEEEFLKRQADIEDSAESKVNGIMSESHDGSNRNFIVDKAKRKPIGKEWGPNSFSSTFTCYFCNEQFRKDYRYFFKSFLSKYNF